MNPSNTNIQLREDIKKGVYVENLVEEEVQNILDAEKILLKGAKNRHMGSTQMNMESSRSHSLFSISV